MRQRGFTLIELMVTVAVVAIVVAIGLPSFQGSLRSNRVATASNELVASIALARSEALRSPGGAAICGTTDGTTCSAAWDVGWMVWTDMDGNGAVGTGDRILRHVEVRPNLTISVSAPVSGEDELIRFDRLGRRIGGDRGFMIQPDVCPAGHNLVRRMAVSPTGQLAVSKGHCT